MVGLEGMQWRAAEMFLHGEEWGGGMSMHFGWAMARESSWITKEVLFTVIKGLTLLYIVTVIHSNPDTIDVQIL